MIYGGFLAIIFGWVCGSIAMSVIEGTVVLDYWID